MPNPSKRWWKVKAEIVGVYGTLSACAADIGCSTESLRQSVEGKCPGVHLRLQKALARRGATLAGV